MSGGLGRKRRARTSIDLGAKNLQDFEEIQRIRNEGQHHHKVKKGSKDGLSKYQLKFRSRKANRLENETDLVMPDLSIRVVHYVYSPYPDNRVFVDGLPVLNYIFADFDGRGYRMCFTPSILRKFSEVEEHYALKPYCNKLDNPVEMKWRDQNFYALDGEILLGERINPRSAKMTLVGKFKTD